MRNMAKEFNLSKKMLDPNGIDMLHKEDVKEFIKRLKKELLSKQNLHGRELEIDENNQFDRGSYNAYIWIENFIDKLAGDDLK